MHSSLTIDIVFEESTPIIDCRRRRWCTVTGSNWMRRIHRWNVDGEHLWDVSCSHQCMGGGSSPHEIEAWWVCCVILTINAMENGEYARHCGSGYKAGGNGCTALLPCDPFLHQSDVPLLLFDGVALRTQRGFEDMMQLDPLH